jgi:thiol-disulfide isomerase/thioredoxin
MLEGPDFDTLGPEVDAAAAGRRRNAIVTIVGIGLCVFVGIKLAAPGGGPGAAGAAGAGNVPAGVNVNRPTLVLFTADWCPPCQTLKSQVLNQPAVVKRLHGSLVFRKVDLTTRDRASSDVARQYGVDGIPTMILFDRRGREIDRYDRAQTVEDFLDWLDDKGV